MAGPSVNVVLRLDSSKVREDAEKAKGLLSTSIMPTVDVFNVASKAVEVFAKGLELAGKGLVFMTERTGAVQSLTSTLDDTRKALGEAADRSGALRSATEAVEEAARSLADFLRSDEGRNAVNDFFGAIISGAASAIDAFNDLSKAYTGVLRFFASGAAEGSAADKFLKSLDAQGQTAAQVARDALVARLRGMADPTKPGSGVLDRGTFEDSEQSPGPEQPAWVVKQIEADRKASQERRKRMEDDLRWEQEGMKAQQQAMEDTLKGLDEFYKAERDAAMRSLDAQRNIAELARTVEEGKTEIAMRNAERRAEIAEKETDAMQRAADRQATIGGLILDGAGYASAGIRQLEEDSKKFDASTKMAAQVGLAISGTLTSVFQAMAQAIGNGEDIGKAVTAALGSSIAALGASAIAGGTYAVVMGTLALAFPPLQFAFPSSGIPAGLAAIGLGGAMLAGGTYLASIASGGSASGPARGSAFAGGGGYRSGNSVVTRRTGFSGTPEGFAGASLAPVTTVLNYNFNGPMGGSPRRIAREIRDLNTVGDTLLPGYRSPGGR